MSTETGKQIALEIGHVLFIDIVSYSKLLINEQSERQRELNEIVRGTEQFRSAKKSGKLIRLSRGDGMALVFFNTVEAPVQQRIKFEVPVSFPVSHWSTAAHST